MTGQKKDDAYYKRMYEDCSLGVYHPFRDHSTQFGWGIVHTASGNIFGYIGAKSEAFGVAAALNGKWEAARLFLKDSTKIPGEYFRQFDQIGYNYLSGKTEGDALERILAITRTLEGTGSMAMALISIGQLAEKTLADLKLADLKGNG